MGDLPRAGDFSCTCRGVGHPHREHGLGREGCCQLGCGRGREPRFVIIRGFATLDLFVVIGRLSDSDSWRSVIGWAARVRGVRVVWDDLG